MLTLDARLNELRQYYFVTGIISFTEIWILQATGILKTDRSKQSLN